MAKILIDWYEEMVERLFLFKQEFLWIKRRLWIPSFPSFIWIIGIAYCVHSLFNIWATRTHAATVRIHILVRLYDFVFEFFTFYSWAFVVLLFDNLLVYFFENFTFNLKSMINKFKSVAIAHTQKQSHRRFTAQQEWYEIWLLALCQKAEQTFKSVLGTVYVGQGLPEELKHLLVVVPHSHNKWKKTAHLLCLEDAWNLEQASYVSRSFAYYVFYQLKVATINRKSKWIPFFCTLAQPVKLHRIISEVHRVVLLHERTLLSDQF